MNIVIIGNSGSGKSWLAAQLARTYRTHLIHLDEIFWEPESFNKKREANAVSALIADSLALRPFIVEGVFGELAEQFLPVADALIFLDLDWAVCKARLKLRGSESAKRHGREQSGQALAELIAWASKYYDREGARSLKGHRALFQSFNGLRICLKREDEADRLLMDIQAKGITPTLLASAAA
jgi:adenylate kinase family enzyme